MTLRVAYNENNIKLINNKHYFAFNIFCILVKMASCGINKLSSDDIEQLFIQTSNLDKRRLLTSAKGVALDHDKLMNFTYELFWKSKELENKHKFTSRCRELQKKYSIAPSYCNINYAYKCWLQKHQTTGQDTVLWREPAIEKFLKAKNVRETSGVLVFTVLTSGTEGFKDSANHGCQWNCYYCPDEPGMPRSYLRGEPAVARADNNDFDAVKQIYDRATVLFLMGKHIDKIELIVDGGTIGSYKVDYIIQFMRDLYYAFNTFYTPIDDRRERLSLQEEININETSLSRVIGLTLETRPDCVKEWLQIFREVGCTRVQLGIQTTNDAHLKLVNRGCYTKHAYEAIALLKDCCFKVDIHIMPDLPNATPESDMKMLDDFNDNQLLQADDWKLYPRQNTQFTLVRKWAEEGKYLPYSHDPEVDECKDLNNSNLRKLIDVLKYILRKVRPWVRINRVIRDIPNHYITEGVFRGDLGYFIEQELIKEGTPSQSIRYREVKGKYLDDLDITTLKKRVIVYHGSNGIEYFISLEDPHHMIYGFVRLRLCYQAGRNIFLELKGCALIRELHVYGIMTPVWEERIKLHVQHRGFGTQLMKWAEQIALQHGYTKMAVIAGVGVRKFYEKKLGYHLVKTYMIKDITPELSPELTLIPENKLNESFDIWNQHHWNIIFQNDIVPDIYPDEFRIQYQKMKKRVNFQKWKQNLTVTRCYQDMYAYIVDNSEQMVLLTMLMAVIFELVRKVIYYMM